MESSMHGEFSVDIGLRSSTEQNKNGKKHWWYQYGMQGENAMNQMNVRMAAILGQNEATQNQ